ncbi:hypothetical protein OKC48_06870 [Methylorubrum extorquens]|uniref:hypothetical protein n=1 Tax=Methylorubrum extorquens TaxID=408 RepID=UPI0022388235|nr:hypothetical protein [Methylorubrum extorquens]UYW28236.1 hypothetical protein OKC48_06870 [Methylorubrum extorquens]
MAHRTRAEARALREEVLRLWAAGSLAPEIAAGLGITLNYASVILSNARRARDQRAAWRESPDGRAYIVPAGRGAAIPGRPWTPKDLVPPKRKRASRASDAADLARREAVLEAWASGRDSREVARKMGLRKGTVTMIVSRARERGDPRAARRQHDPAAGMSLSLRRALDRAARLHGVTVTVPEPRP